MKTPRKRDEKSISVLRILAGAYLLYTDYKLIKGWSEVAPGQKPLFAVIMAVFGIVAVLLIVFSLKDYFYYKNHPVDPEEKTEDKAKAEGLTDEERTADEPIHELPGDNEKVTDEPIQELPADKEKAADEPIQELPEDK